MYRSIRKKEIEIKIITEWEALHNEWFIDYCEKLKPDIKAISMIFALLELKITDEIIKDITKKSPYLYKYLNSLCKGKTKEELSNNNDELIANILLSFVTVNPSLQNTKRGYIGKTLAQILNISHEECLVFFRAKKDTKKYNVLVKAFDESLDEIYHDVLNPDEKNVLRMTITEFRNVLKRIDNFEGLKLEEITKMPYQKLIKKLDEQKTNNPKVYSLFTSAFGEKIDKEYNSNNLTAPERIELYQEIMLLLTKYSRAFKKGQKLEEIIGTSYEIVLVLAEYIKENDEEYQQLIKLFGEKIDQISKISNKKEEDKKSNLIKRLKRLFQAKYIFDNKTIDEILEINYDYALEVIKVLDKSLDRYKIFAKVFGSDFSQKSNLKMLTKDELELFNRTVIILKNRLCPPEERKNKFNGFKLEEIINKSHEETLDFMNKKDKNTQVYSIFLKIFGEQYNDIFDSNKVSTNEFALIYSSLNNIQKDYPRKDRRNYRNQKLEEILNVPYDKLLSLISDARLGANFISALKKAFGDKYDQGYNPKILTPNEIMSVNRAITILQKILEGELYNNKRYNCLKLEQILGLSYEEALKRLKNKRKTSKGYIALTKAFGEHFDQEYNPDNLTQQEKAILYNYIFQLKVDNTSKKKSPSKDESKTIIKPIPIEDQPKKETAAVIPVEEMKEDSPTIEPVAEESSFNDYPIDIPIENSDEANVLVEKNQQKEELIKELIQKLPVNQRMVLELIWGYYNGVEYTKEATANFLGTDVISIDTILTKSRLLLEQMLKSCQKSLEKEEQEAFKTCLRRINNL